MVEIDLKSCKVPNKMISFASKLGILPLLIVESETDLKGNVIVSRYECVTSYTARRTVITNMYLSHKYTFLQMMHVSGHNHEVLAEHR